MVSVAAGKEDFMNYIYKMSRRMFIETLVDAKKSKMSIEDYVAATFGLRGKCVKVEAV